MLNLSVRCLKIMELTRQTQYSSPSLSLNMLVSNFPAVQLVFYRGQPPHFRNRIRIGHMLSVYLDFALLADYNINFVAE